MLLAEVVRSRPIDQSAGLFEVPGGHGQVRARALEGPARAGQLPIETVLAGSTRGLPHPSLGEEGGGFPRISSEHGVAQLEKAHLLDGGLRGRGHTQSGCAGDLLAG